MRDHRQAAGGCQAALVALDLNGATSPQVTEQGDHENSHVLFIPPSFQVSRICTRMHQKHKRIKLRSTHQRSAPGLTNPHRCATLRGRHPQGQTRGGRKASGHQASLRWVLRVCKGPPAGAPLCLPHRPWGLRHVLRSESPAHVLRGSSPRAFVCQRAGPKDPLPGSRCLRTK